MYYHDAMAIITPHFPQFQTMSHMPKIMTNFDELFLKKEVGVELQEIELMMNLGPWFDPTPLLPHRRLLTIVRGTSQRVTFMINTKALWAAQMRTSLKHLQLSVS